MTSAYDDLAEAEQEQVTGYTMVEGDLGRGPGAAFPESMDEPASYDPAYFARLAPIEDQHFWFRARNQVISALLPPLLLHLPPGYCVLEVGCGTGNVLRVLEITCSGGRVYGMDAYAEGLRFAQARVSCPLIQGDMRHAPFRTKFDVIGLFDTLEHLPDDEQVLRDLRTLLAPRGRLLLTVPAHQSLWSYFDAASHHHRRYEPIELAEKLTTAGYRVEFLTLYMAGIFPLVWLGRRWTSLRMRSAGADADQVHDLAQRELRIIPLVNEILYQLLKLEAHLLARRKRLPIGTSLLAVASL